MRTGGIEQPVQFLGAALFVTGRNTGPAVSAPSPASARHSSMRRCVIACTGTNRIFPRLPLTLKCITPVVRLDLRWHWGVFCGRWRGCSFPSPIQCHGGRPGWGAGNDLCASVIAAASSMVRFWSKCASCASIRPKLKQGSGTTCAGAILGIASSAPTGRRLYRRLPLS
jgi:hypothetical protein